MKKLAYDRYRGWSGFDPDLSGVGVYDDGHSCPSFERFVSARQIVEEGLTPRQIAQKLGVEHPDEVEVLVWGEQEYSCSLDEVVDLILKDYAYFVELKEG